jgi:uncharacterized surface protein with fasciclin (FAS1) repeats
MMKPMMRLFLALQLAGIFGATNGKEPYVALRGSDETSVTNHERASAYSNKNEFVRYLQLDNLREISLWEYMDQIDSKYSDAAHYSRFRSLVVAADRKDHLNVLTGITLLAPTDEGISREIQEFLLLPENNDILKEFIEYHMIPRVLSFLSPAFSRGSKVTTITKAGEYIDIKVNRQGVHFNMWANAISYVLTHESILYRIDRLLIPPSMNSRVPEKVLMTNVPNTTDVAVTNINYEFPIVIPDDFWGEGNDGTNDAVETSSDIPETTVSNPQLTDSSESPSLLPSDTPSLSLSDAPSMYPSDAPSTRPSDAPSTRPSDAPSSVPSDVPSIFPFEPPKLIVPFIVSDDSFGSQHTGTSFSSTMSPSSVPSNAPSSVPSAIPSSVPSVIPSSIPSNVPSITPSDVPSTIPSKVPMSEVRAATADLFWDLFSPGGIKRKVLPPKD